MAQQETTQKDILFLDDVYIRATVFWFLKFLEIPNDDIIVKIENQRSIFRAISLLLQSASFETRGLVIKEYIRLYHTRNQGQKIFKDIDYLSEASMELRVGVSQEISESVVHEVVKAGWYGRAESMIHKFLQRDPNEEEITMLVDSYVNNKATFSTDCPRALMELAKNYLSHNKVLEIQERLEQFEKEFNEHDCY